MRPKVQAVKHGPDSDQQAVLFDVVQSVQHPEWIIPSFVWFEGVDRFECFLPRTVHFSVLFGVVFLGTVSNREVDPVRVRRLVPRVSASGNASTRASATLKALFFSGKNED
jgi:hypothetical protein